MTSYMSRRNVLTALVALPAAGMLLSACGEAGSQTSSAAPATDSTTTSSTAAAPRPQGTVDMTKLLEPGALPEMVLGEENAPVTIVEYASVTCSHCAAFHANTLPAIKERYIDTGKARLIMREFPVDERDTRARAGFMLARCSGDNYFPMLDVLFKQQMEWAGAENARDPLLRIARLGGISEEQFNACLSDNDLGNNVLAVRRRGASEFGVNATPTFFINGNKYAGALSVDEMSAIIDSML